MSRASPHVDGRKVRAERRRAQRKIQILQAARAVFAARGYHASSVADILDQAGIARGTFYLYFPGKRAVFEELVDQMFAQIEAATFRIRTGADAEPVEAQMHRNVLAQVNVLESNRELTIILLREAVGVDADFDRKLDDFYDRLAGMVEAALVLGQTMGVVRKCDTRLMSLAVLGSLKEVMARLLPLGALDRKARHAVAREITAYNLVGLFNPLSAPLR